MAYVRKPQGADEQDQLQGADRVMSGYGGAPTTPTMTMQPSQNFATPTRAPTDSGPSATGYINFDRFFNANQGAAKKTASNVAGQVSNQADAAKKSLGDVQTQFGNAVKSGTTSSPTNADFNYATTGRMPGPVSSQSALQQAPNAATTQRPTTPGNSIHTPNASDEESRITNGMNGAGYTGPTSLDVMSGYGDAQAQGKKAQDMLDATKSQYGLQGLLQSQAQPAGYSDQMSAFDAGLTGAAGGQQFADLRNQYGNFDKMFSDASAQAADQAKAAQQNGNAAVTQWGLANQANQARKGVSTGVPGDSGAPNSSAPWQPTGYKDFNSFMNNAGDMGQNTVHQLGMGMSPVDQIWNAIPGLGNRSPSDMYGGMYGGSATGNAAPDQTIREGFGDISKQYGNAGAQWFWNNLNPKLWQQMLGMNKYDVVRTMQAIMNAAIADGRFKPSTPGSPGGRSSEVQQQGQASGGENTGIAGYGGSATGQTDSDFETARNQAYANGWGEEFDKQARSGVKNPKEPGK